MDGTSRRDRSRGLRALDTLPLRIAIVDRHGTIVETNRSWRTFAAENGIEDPSMIGVDYLDPSDVDGAENPREGVEAVLRGRRTATPTSTPARRPPGRAGS
ncbi:MAG: hypothetical protein ACOCPT_02765 [Halanaeroarchaeum sp.]